VHDACWRDVKHVFVDGRQVVANGEPVMVDARRILAEAQAASEALWARGGITRERATSCSSLVTRASAAPGLCNAASD